MADNGDVFDVGLINSNRCARVLPSIDTYLLAASQALGSAVTLIATRPLLVSR